MPRPRIDDHRLAAEGVPAAAVVVLALVGGALAVPAVSMLAGGAGGGGGGGATTPAVPTAAPAAAAALPVAVPGTAPTAAPTAPAVAPSAPAPVPADCPPLFSILFESNSGTPHVEPALVGALATWIIAHPAALLIVDGHASSRGTPGLNLELSHRRANKAATLFEQAGVPRERITRRAFGAYAPVVGRPEQAGINRRVTLEIQGGPDCPPPPEPTDEVAPSPSSPEVRP